MHVFFRSIWYLLLVISVITVSGCGKPSVAVMTASLSQVPLSIDEDITLEAVHSASVIPMVSGTIISEIPSVGTSVKTGQILFQVDTLSYEEQATNLRAKIAQSYTVKVPAELPIDNNLEASLLKQGIITRAEYNRIQGRKTVESNVNIPDGLSESLQAIEKAILDCSVRAPIDGVVSAVYIGTQKNATAGRPALAIQQETLLSTIIELPSHIDSVVEMAKAQKTLTVSISDGKNVWYAELTKQNKNGENGYSYYKIQVDNPNKEIKVGQSYKLHIETGQTDSCYVIPTKSILKNNQIAVVTAEHLIDMRTVVIASTIGDNTLLLDGVKEGEQIVISPTKELQIGTAVTIR